MDAVLFSPSALGLPWEEIASAAIKNGLCRAAGYLCEGLSSPPEMIGEINPILWVVKNVKDGDKAITLCNILNNSGILITDEVLREMLPTRDSTKATDFVTQRAKIIGSWQKTRAA